jgi:hypothetical protein
MGERMGSVKEKRSCTGLLPRATGNQERITRANRAMYRNRKK